jgi:aminoglycoside phosphotransferase (APT) family kinase protein
MDVDLGERVATGSTAEVFALGSDRVLKRFFDSDPERARREAANTRVASAAGLRVPRVYEVTAVDGRPAVLYERVDGPTMLERLESRPWLLGRAARRLAAIHAEVHSVGPDDRLPPLRERLAGNVDRAPGLSRAVRRRVRAELASLDDEETLCHGDVHPGNVLCAPQPTLIDWLDATRGPPAADVARTSLLLRFGGHGVVASLLGRVLERRYRRAYRDRTGLPDARVRAWALPVAAARLNEAVPEAPRLRAFVHDRLRGR